MDRIIASFVDVLIERKELQFSISDVNHYKILIESDILKFENNIISIINYKLISSYFFSKYKLKFDFEISEDFTFNVDFIKRVKIDFTNGGYVHDYILLERELWKLIIEQSHSNFKFSFSLYLKSIDLANKPNEIFGFTEAYSSLLKDLDLPSAIILENALILTEITKSDADYNLNLETVLNGIKSKCKNDYELGLELLEKSLHLSEGSERVISSVISGLYENKRSKFYDSVLKELLQKGEKLNPILFGLSNVSTIEETECMLFIELITKHKKSISLVFSKLSLVFSILKSNNSKYNSFSFNELETAIEDEKTANYILNNLLQLNNYEEEKTEIITKLINQNYFTIEKFIRPISANFWHLKEFVCFKKVVSSIIENKPFEEFIKSFQSYYYSVEKDELGKFVVELLTNNKASIRATGLEIFNELSIYNPYLFDFDVLELSYLSQYKLWVSLTQNFHDPKKIIISLLPLIHSKSELIRESFLCKLEEITENYGELVINVLKESINEGTSNRASVIMRIEKYFKDYYGKNVNLKNSILELNPYQTHYRFIKKYNSLFQKNINKSLDIGASENSLLSILGSNTIRLAKGGGWRFGPKKEIAQLESFSSSFSLPRSYFIDPNKFELEVGILCRKDWIEEDFLEIKNFLDNE